MTESIPFFLAAAFAISVLVTWTVRTIALRRQLLDQPNERSAHVRPTPRLGGIGIMGAFLPAAVLVAQRHGSGRALLAIGGTAFISLVGLVDDLRPLSARVRFGAQCMAAAVVVGAGWEHLGASWGMLGALPVWLLAPLSFLWIVWLTNLYNFMDGIDGLAAGQAIVAGVGVAVVATAGGTGLQGLLAALLASAAAGFLVFNFPPASIFMGDVGSTAIGFFFASLPFVGGGATIPVEVVALLLALFILDATTTLIRRLARGEKFFQAHRTHLYQRPLALGVPHRRITLAAYVGMILLAVGASTWPARGVAWRIALMASGVLLFVSYALAVASLERRAGEVKR